MSMSSVLRLAIQSVETVKLGLMSIKYCQLVVKFWVQSEISVDGKSLVGVSGSSAAGVSIGVSTMESEISSVMG